MQTQHLLRLLFFLSLIAAPKLNVQAQKVPGVVIDHIPASGKTYIGSPSICILSNGDYVASHDYFGPASTENEQALTAVFTSSDKGKSWRKISEIKGQFWSNLFVHRDVLYMMGTWKQYGNFILRRSTDGGHTWTAPVDSKHGLLLEGEYHTAPMAMLIHNGRIWRAMENAKADTKAWGQRYSAMVISAPVDSDLLDAANWKATNCLPYDSSYLGGKFGGWLEGNILLTRDGKLVDFLRVATSEKGQHKGAMVNISDDGSHATFNPDSGFMDFGGGGTKFEIRYDKRSKRYFTLSNDATEELAQLPSGSVRNRLVLKSSPDLKNWTVHKVLLVHPDHEKHGFQYIDWQFDRQDIIFVSRTAYDDEFGGAHNFHDANYLTFHRVRNFRRLKN